MENKKIRQNRGITLIALIVTIIVLLILAGISIAMLAGDNGILRQATNAKEKSDLAQTEERIKLAVNSAYMDEKGMLNYEKLIEELQKEFEDGNYEIAPNNSNAESWTITVGKAEVQMKNENYVAPTAVYAYKATSQEGTSTDTLILSSKGDLTSVNGYNLDVYRNDSNEPYDISSVEFTSASANPWYDSSENSYIKYVDIIDEIAPIYCDYWFYNCQNLNKIKNIANLKTDNVKSMTSMFGYCSMLDKLDVSQFSTSNVVSMKYMFERCVKLESLNLKNFHTSNVTDMHGMFQRCSSLKEIDLVNFNTSKVIDMIGMFNQCTSLENVNVSSFDTSEVTNMQGMFNMCKSLQSLDISNFNMSKVTNVQYMLGFETKENRKITKLYIPATNGNGTTNSTTIIYGKDSSVSYNLNDYDEGEVILK